jgi:hypothetical protein
VERVLEFFGDNQRAATADELDADTTLSKSADDAAKAAPRPPRKATSSPNAS